MVKNPTFTELKELPNEPQILRNFQCPEYDTCLATAAFRNFDLQCSKCQLSDIKREIWITQLEPSGCAGLIDAVFASD
jgi:hypothetical protein